MKRGLIAWDKGEIPVEEFDRRLGGLQDLLQTFDIPALVAYSDVWRSNDVRYISNYMPYWNRALSVVPKGERPILLCSLSPRVYPWIKSVTIHETILPSPNLAVQLARVADERGWEKLGVLDLMGLPVDLFTHLRAQKLRMIDIPRNALRLAPTAAEIAMHSRAAKLIRGALEEVLATPAAAQSDHQLTGNLERTLRRAGAEDLVILTSDGTTSPRPARGRPVEKYTSVVAALEHNGHWAKLSRNMGGLRHSLEGDATVTLHREVLSGPYSWEGAEAPDGRKSIVSVHAEIRQDGRRLYFGDTCVQGPQGLQII